MIACPSSDNRNGIYVIDRFSSMVRLGEGLNSTNYLSDAAIKRTTEALKVCAQKIKFQNVNQTIAITTEVCRQANNKDDFFQHVKQETGIKFKTITPTEEAQLTLAGCLPLLTKDHSRVLMFDIGGGSTELIWLKKKPSKDPIVIDILSIPIGVVNLAEKYGAGKLSAEAYMNITNRIDAELAPFEDRHHISSQISKGNVHMLGTSGTMTTMGSIYLNQIRYDRAQVDGLSIRYESISAICKNILSLDFEERQSHPCIGPGRADLIVMGCIILTAICRRWPATHLTAADRGIREGLILEMMTANQAGV